MADITFPCPHCNQFIACDEAWCGQQIQCPTCQGALIAPPAPASTPTAAADNPLVPKPPSGPTPRLSVGTQSQKPATPGHSIPIRDLAPPPPKKKNPLVPIAVTIVVLAGLGTGGYFGYNFYLQHKAKTAEAEKKADASQAAAETNAPAPAAPAKAPPPVWTLDLDAAKVPAGLANGALCGTNFVPDTVRVDPVGTAQVLRFTQGPVASPDREVLIYMHLKAGEKLGGQTWNISKDMKGAAVPQVIKRWKATPNSALTVKTFSSGYAMKLELGQRANDVVPGTIFLALPDPEQSVVGGAFKVAASIAATGASTNPAATPAAPAGAAERSAYERRYGTRR